jgi:hypothetical protein
MADLCLKFRTIYGGKEPSRNRLSYRPARLHRLAESIPWNRILGSLKVPKREIFVTELFILSDPILVGDLRTELLLCKVSG